MQMWQNTNFEKYKSNKMKNLKIQILKNAKPTKWKIWKYKFLKMQNWQNANKTKYKCDKMQNLKNAKLQNVNFENTNSTKCKHNEM